MARVLMWNLAGWYGGARHDAISSAHSIIWHRTRVHTIDATGVQVVTLPDATKLRVGFPLYLIVCDTGSDNITIKDAGGTPIVVLSADNKALLGLTDNTTTAGTWIHVES